MSLKRVVRVCFNGTDARGTYSPQIINNHFPYLNFSCASQRLFRDMNTTRHVTSAEPPMLHQGWE